MTEKSVKAKELVKILRETWLTRLRPLREELSSMAKIPGDEKSGEQNIVSKGLKVWDKSLNLFTVDSVSADHFVLKDPNGEKINVTREDFDNDYQYKRG
jgi:hypothetical protein